MSILFSLIVHTANILGSFEDPFEFAGDYGPDINPVRQTVFEHVVSKEAMGDFPSDAAIDLDRQHGPSLSELIAPSLLQELTRKQQELGETLFPEQTLIAFSSFIDKFGDEMIFRFLRHTPSELLNLDKTLKDVAAREGHSLILPILGSTTYLEGTDSFTLKVKLLDALFTEQTIASTKSEAVINKALQSLDNARLQDLLGPEATKEELYLFSSPSGQVLFYWLYQALDLHLVAEIPGLVTQINEVKQTFARTLGDPKARATAFRQQLIDADNGVLFTQEADATIRQELLKEGLYLPVDKQGTIGATLVFLRSDLWEPDYTVIPIEDYEGYAKGRLSLILATHQATGEKFLLASGHGNSTRAEDGRLQVRLVMDQFHQLAQNPANAGLQLIMGIDANTKNETDVALLHQLLDTLGLVATKVGPTTVKKRMVTAQHSKAGRMAIDEEDFLITLQPEMGGRYALTSPTLGFSSEAPDQSRALPDINNRSDHYSVGALLH